MHVLAALCTCCLPKSSVLAGVSSYPQGPHDTTPNCCMQGFGPTTYTLPSLFWLIVKKPRVSSVQHDICLAAATSGLQMLLSAVVLTTCGAPADDQLALLGLMGQYHCRHHHHLCWCHWWPEVRLEPGLSSSCCCLVLSSVFCCSHTCAHYLLQSAGVLLQMPVPTRSTNEH